MSMTSRLHIQITRINVRRCFAALTFVAGVMAAVGVGHSLSNPSTLVSDSIGRALLVAKADIPAIWEAPVNIDENIASVSYRTDDGDHAGFTTALNTDLSQPKSSPLKKLMSVGDQITITDGVLYVLSTGKEGGVGTISPDSWSLEIIGLAILSEKITRLDNSLNAAQFIKVTARDVGESDAQPISFILTLDAPLAMPELADLARSL